MSDTSISYLWREPKAAEGFKAGVSLHSHTQPVQRDAGFHCRDEPGFSDPAADHALGGRPLGREDRDSSAICEELLDPAADTRAGVRSGRKAD